MTFTTVQINFAPGPHTRFETFDGREYLVAPMVMLTVGVHAGSNGPVLYEESDLAKTPEAWNMKPLVVYHPTENGQGISACTATVIEQQGVGLIMNTRWDGKLRAEAWFDVEKTKKVDERILTALEEGKMMEVSTGLFTDNEQTEGTWNAGNGSEQPYAAIARNYRPDHLAILPDKIGACSIAKGAGLLQTNALSNADTAGQLSRILRDNARESNETRPYHDVYLVDVFDGWFIFAEDDKLYRSYFTKENDIVQIVDGLRESVIPQTVYRTVDGALIGNSSVDPVFTPPSEDDDMTKKGAPTANVKKIVDGLISNEDSPWTEDDRELLSAKDEASLARLESDGAKDGGKDDKKKEGKKSTADMTDEELAAEMEKRKKAKEKKTDNQAPGTPKPVSVDEYISNAPAGMQDVLRSGVAAHEAERAKLIQTITANDANVFTAEQLGEMPKPQLQGLAALASSGSKPGEGESESYHSVPQYYGAGGGAPQQNAGTQNGAAEDEPLDLPVMNWES